MLLCRDRTMKELLSGAIPREKLPTREFHWVRTTQGRVKWFLGI